MFGRTWLREVVEGYRWLWRAQLRWRPGPRWLSGVRFLGRAIADIARAALSTRHGGTMIRRGSAVPLSAIFLAKCVAVAGVMLVVALLVISDGHQTGDDATGRVTAIPTGRCFRWIVRCGRDGE